MPVDLSSPYDPTNVFARILRRELPVNFIYEDDFVVAFADLNPQAPIHLLIIPRGTYVSFADFAQLASADEITGMARAISKITQQLGLDKKGYRLVSNTGPHGGQEVPHYHVHLLGGSPLPPQISE